MKKHNFLVPVAAAAAALSGAVDAKPVESIDVTAPSSIATIASKIHLSGIVESFYENNGELHSLMMKPSLSGDVFAYHGSHSSHSSHSSHYSHRSGR